MKQNGSVKVGGNDATIRGYQQELCLGLVAMKNLPKGDHDGRDIEQRL